MPFTLIPFLLLVVPIVEIAMFIVIGGAIGLWPTLAMILVTAIIGTFLLRHQGFQIVDSIRRETEAGRIPGRQLGDGAMILVAGVLLLTPGFVTDGLGFLLFVPPVRTMIWSFLASRVTVASMSATGQGEFHRSRRDRREDGDDMIIELDDDEYSSSADPTTPWNRSNN
ncbi:MAG: FxsA family protein [Pseudomonadota bacterium]